MKRHLLPLCLALLGLSAALPAAPVQAQQADDLVEMRVLPGWRAADGTHMAALDLRLLPGWKTYWRAPGDAGIPPQFDWRRSRNLSGAEIVWPTPRVIVQGDLQSIGYSDRVVLPLRLDPSQDGREIKLKGTIEIGVCSDICVPVRLKVNETLAAAAAKPDPRIAAALASRPYSASEAGVGRVACSVSAIQDGLGLRAEIDLPNARDGETAIVEVDDPKIWVSQAKTKRKGNRLVAETRLYHVDGRSFALNRSGIRITVLSSSRAVDIQGCPAG